MGSGTKAVRKRLRDRKVLLVGAALVVALSAGPARALTPTEAKALADRSEASLTHEQSAALIAAQGDVAKTAFPACQSGTGAKPHAFTVVMELKATGTVVASWVIGESAFAQCLRDAMVQQLEYRPPSLPFFTSFEYQGSPK